MKQTDAISPGHRNGCHSQFTGERKRGGPNKAMLNTERVNLHGPGKLVEMAQRVEPVTTNWLPIPCGHDLRLTDPACQDCVNRDRG